MAIKSKMTLSIELITPEIAMRMLESNTHNRKIYQQRIDEYAALIEGGRFQTIHQGLAFHRDGRLVDGQHRLWAVVLTGKSVEMAVAKGLNDAEVAAIDNGLTRSYQDHGHYQGWEDAANITSGIVRWMVGGPSFRARRVPPDVLHSWQEFYDDGVSYAYEAYKTVRPQARRLTAPMLASIGRAWYVLNLDVMDRFVEILKTGQKSFDADNAAVALRDAWLAGRLGSISDQYFKVQGALRAFRDRRPIRNLQRPDKDIFAIPKLPKDARFEIPNTLSKRLEIQQHMLV